MEPAVVIVNAVIVSLGVPSIIGGLIYIGKKMQTLEDIKHTINTELKPSITTASERFSALGERVRAVEVMVGNNGQKMFGAASPVKLTPIGETALEESGLKKYIDEHPEFLAGCECVREANPYEVQQYCFKVIDTAVFDAEIDAKVKDYAYEHGATVEVIRRVGGIYLRDLCLRQFEMKKEDIDKHDPEKQQVHA